MSTFIEKTDWSPYLRDQRLNQMTDQDDGILDTVEETAIQAVKDSVHPYYDIDTIFAQTGTDRAKSVVRWVMCLAVYYLYERIPDNMVPERVIKNYDDCLDMLKRIADGKQSLDLPPKVDEESVPLTKFRGGVATKRTHDYDEIV